MGAIQEILAGLDVDQLARTLNADPAAVQEAATTALGSLLSGLEANASAEDGAVSLANALGQHLDDDNAAPQTGAIDLSKLDFNDGAKIVNHILPAQQQHALFGGAQGALILRLLPLLAPIVMSFLAKRLQSSGGLGSILGGLLGGQETQQGSGGLGAILGQVLGGGQAGAQAQQSSGGLGDLLGQVLGGQQAAPAQAGTAGGLQMDDSGYDAQAAQQQTPSVGGLLKSILFG